MIKLINEIGASALQTIKQKKISPRPKWRYWLYGGMVWGASLFFVAVGSLAFSVIIYMVRNNDWDLSSHLGDSFWEFVLVTLPYFWIVLSIILGSLALYISKFTPKAYRYKLVTLLSLGLFANIVLGSAFYYLGLGQLIDERLQADVPAYNYLSLNKEKMWTQPEKGILSGTIVSSDDSEIGLRDYLGNLWTLELNSSTIIRGRMRLAPDLKIKIIGEKIDDNKFSAQEIRPWQGQGLGNGRRTQGY